MGDDKIMLNIIIAKAHGKVMESIADMETEQEFCR